MWANALIDRLLDTQVEVEAETLSVKLCAVKTEALIHWVTFPQPKKTGLETTRHMGNVRAEAMVDMAANKVAEAEVYTIGFKISVVEGDLQVNTSLWLTQ